MRNVVVLILTVAFSNATFASDSFAGATENNQGVTKMNAGNYKGAIQAFTLALRKNPSYVLALENRALAKRKLNDFKGALADYSEILRLDPSNFYALSGRAYAYEGLGQLDRAVAEFTKVIERDEKSRPFYLHARALVKKKQGDIEGAKSDLDEERKLRDSMGTSPNI